MIRLPDCWIFVFLALVFGPLAPFAKSAPATDAKPKKIVFIAGTKSHGPGHHEYEQGLLNFGHGDGLRSSAAAFPTGTAVSVRGASGASGTEGSVCALAPPTFNASMRV